MANRVPRASFAFQRERMTKVSVLFFLVLVIASLLLVNVSLGADHKHGYKEEIGVYELKKGKISVKLTNWGATIMSLLLPDKYGKYTSIPSAAFSFFFFYNGREDSIGHSNWEIKKKKAMMI